MSKKNNKVVAKQKVNPFDRFNREIVEEIQFGTKKQTTIKFTAKNGKNDIDKHEVEAIFDTIEAVGEDRANGRNIRTIVRGMNCQRMFTLKALDGPLKIKDFEEYYENRVKDEHKFEMFSEINVTILVEEPKKEINKNIFKKNKK